MRSLRITNTAWEDLDAIARKNNLIQSESIELLINLLDGVQSLIGLDK